ncbi:MULTISPECIES: hypothetical protein [unclassified Caballeronia]|uniref:hypothetical protein n=1 Tax=unclassified Caballeronia TaxID=2646786 RepID=UPI002867A593|nr:MULTISPECIES: hypothetical protein [unclassified Caballeronia]MDR5751359.1 hypothetical protein [Caballeronia sp. LZ024]MDR5844499.1 hypothetical protein [Caballeronia sp. LZ031]
MPVPKYGDSLFRLFRDTPFPRIKLLAGGNADERSHALTCVSDCDVLVVAGGLGDIVSSVEALSKSGLPVVYVPGIEECRGREITSVAAAGREAAADTLVNVLERDQVVLDGVRFLGAPLWTSPEDSRLDIVGWFAKTATDLKPIGCADWWREASNAADASAICAANEWAMPDFSTAEGHVEMHPAVAMVEHRRTLKWLADRLAYKFDGPTIIVSYFEPRAVEGVHTDASLRPSRSRLLLRENQESVDLWLYGHARVQEDVVIESVRVFGGHTEPDFDIGDFMAGKLAEVAAKRARRGKVDMPPREPLQSPTVEIETGLLHPLSRASSRLLAQMKAVEKSVSTIVPHTMGRSPTLRQCVRRTIHAEMQLFKRAGHEAWQIERELYPPSNNVEAALMHARTDYDPPHGYPSQESKESAFDYYRMLDEMNKHIDWLSELPSRAHGRLQRWARGAYDILQELHSRDIEARAVAPSPHALRLERLARRLEVKVKAKDFDFETIRTEARKALAFDGDWSFALYVSSTESFEGSSGRLLSLAELKGIVTAVNSLAPSCSQ